MPKSEPATPAATIWALSQMPHLRQRLIALKILRNHPLRRKPPARRGPAGFAVQLGGGSNRLRHFRFAFYQKTRPPIFHDFRQCAGGKRNHRCARRQRFHRHQRTGFRRQARREQTTRAAQQPLLAPRTQRTKEAMPAIEPGQNLLAMIALVRFVAKNLPAQPQRPVRARGGIQSDVKALLRTDATEREGVTAFRVWTGKALARNPVLNFRQKQWAGRTTQALRARDAVQPGQWPRELENFRWIPRRRQMQGHQHRQPRRRQIAVEVDPVHMNEVDWMVSERLFNRGTMPLLRGLAGLEIGRAWCRERV